MWNGSKPLLEWIWWLLYYFAIICEWNACCSISHEGDSRAKVSIFKRVWNEGFGSSKSDSRDEDHTR